MTSPSSLVLVANTRMPSKRAQALQVAQVAGAFSRSGVATTLVHAKRTHTMALPDGQSIWDYYGVAAAPQPEAIAVSNLDAIDFFPRWLQYAPARIQEWSFYRAAARLIREEHSEALVLSREVETARALLRSGISRVFLEVHRVPGGRLRRAWLEETTRSALGVLAISGGVREDLIAMELLQVAIEPGNAQSGVGERGHQLVHGRLEVAEHEGRLVGIGMQEPAQHVQVICGVGGDLKLFDVRQLFNGGLDRDTDGVVLVRATD